MLTTSKLTEHFGTEARTISIWLMLNSCSHLEPILFEKDLALAREKWNEINEKENKTKLEKKERKKP